MSYRTKLYWAYGMNTNIGEMAFRCPQAHCLGPATLQDFRLTFKQHADIDWAPGAEMQGVLWLITDQCELNLDILEGYPTYYDKIRVKVQSGSVGLVEAMAYQMVYTTGRNALGMPSPQYIQCLEEGYTDNGLDVNQIYAALEEFSDYAYQK